MEHENITTKGRNKFTSNNNINSKKIIFTQS